MSQPTVQLYRQQKAFLDSPALFRGFCGGIGSGKSWVGAYDLLKRGKPDRLYLVASPSYSMLADSTFRSFVALAEQLGVVAPGDVKRSAPPSIKLRTGAEILFRSADNPDSMRGPNLSGVWLDEASLMHQDAFTVAIGRLREGGEQGWLSATFTPKGRKHWTYETLATGSPDTAIFHARTSDNPFLPANFDSTVRRKYTTALAAQELEGLFVDGGGILFQRSWFAIVDRLPVLTQCVRAWDLAGTPKGKNPDPDFTVGALMGKDEGGTHYILDVRRARSSPQQVQELVRTTAEADGEEVAIHMEQEPGSAGVFVVDAFLRLLTGYNFHGERSTGDKTTRAVPFAAQAEGGTVKLVRGVWNKDFLDEIEVFPTGNHDDQVDAASLAFSKISAGFNWDGYILREPRPDLMNSAARGTWAVESRDSDADQRELDMDEQFQIMGW